MIWMPIRPSWPKGDHHIGLHPTHMSRDLRDHLGWIGLIQVTINVIQEIDTADSQHPGGCQQLLLAYLAQRFQSWILALVAKPATFTPGRCDEVGFDAFSDIFREDAAIAQRFIVGMCQYAHQF